MSDTLRWNLNDNIYNFNYVVLIKGVRSRKIKWMSRVTHIGT